MKIEINFLFFGQFSYHTWHSQPCMLVIERHHEYANKKLLNNFGNFHNINIFLETKRKQITESARIL